MSAAFGYSSSLTRGNYLPTPDPIPERILTKGAICWNAILHWYATNIIEFKSAFQVIEFTII
jgi:hypothetical protein